MLNLHNQSFPKNITFVFPKGGVILNATTGVSVRYGNFVFKIHDQELICRGDWAKKVVRN